MVNGEVKVGMLCDHLLDYVKNLAAVLWMVCKQSRFIKIR